MKTVKLDKLIKLYQHVDDKSNIYDLIVKE